MTTEYLIHKIIEVDTEIESDIKLESELDNNCFGDDVTEPLDDKITKNMALLDSLKATLAEKVVEDFTGVSVRHSKYAEET